MTLFGWLGRIWSCYSSRIGQDLLLDFISPAIGGCLEVGMWLGPSGVVYFLEWRISAISGTKHPRQFPSSLQPSFLGKGPWEGGQVAIREDPTKKNKEYLELVSWDLGQILRWHELVDYQWQWLVVPIPVLDSPPYSYPCLGYPASVCSMSCSATSKVPGAIQGPSYYF